MVTITLVIRNQKVLYEPFCEVSVQQLKNDLPSIIAAKFPDSPTLPSSEFKLFGGTHGNTLLDVDKIMGESVIFVFEIFTITPCPLYRTIRPNQIHPVVRTIHEDNPWSKMSPLYCGAFRLASSQITDGSPFHFSDPADCPKMGVRGMSLKSEVPRKERAELTDPVDGEEDVGWTKLSNISVLRDEITPSDFGKLNTPTLLDRDDASNGEMDVNIAATSQSKGPSTEVNNTPLKTRFFFAYELPVNTNLEAFGMAVVYDNADPDYPGQFTLIPWKHPMKELRKEAYTTNSNVLTVQVPNNDD